jgi:hypothetical protein
MDKQNNIENIYRRSSHTHHHVSYTTGVKVFITLLLMISMYLAYWLGDIIFGA